MDQEAIPTASGCAQGPQLRTAAIMGRLIIEAGSPLSRRPPPLAPAAIASGQGHR